jgi:flagellar biogenesis protein FliO
MKKITIIKRNHEKEGIKYIIPDVGDMFTKTINETREEISDMNAIAKHLPSILAIIILIIVAIIMYLLKGTMSEVSNLAGPISYLADVLNSSHQLPPLQ